MTAPYIGDREPCLWCDGPMDSEWARSTQRYCSLRCKNAAWYVKHKEHHQQIYAAKRRDWERSRSGRREGIPIRQWLRLPDDWR